MIQDQPDQYSRLDLMQEGKMAGTIIQKFPVWYINPSPTEEKGTENSKK